MTKLNNFICKYCDIEHKGYVTINNIIWILGDIIILITVYFLCVLPLIHFYNQIFNDPYTPFVLFGIGIDLVIILTYIIYI